MLWYHVVKTARSLNGGEGVPVEKKGRSDTVEKGRLRTSQLTWVAHQSALDEMGAFRNMSVNNGEAMKTKV